MSATHAGLNRTLDRLDAILRVLEFALDRRRPSRRSPLSDNKGRPETVVLKVSPRRSRSASSLFAGAIRQRARDARRVAMPVSLAAVLATMALLRMPSANTGWTEQLVVDSSVGTGDFKCDPVKLTFVEARAAGTDTKFVYALSGGGGTGPKCQDEAISQVFIPVCFNPALQPVGDTVFETHPGGADTSWKFAADPAVKRVTWKSLVPIAPLGGNGPFEPATMRFSFTLAGDVAVNPVQVHAGFMAGGDEFDAGLVKGPKCPLPVAAAPLMADSATPVASSDPAGPVMTLKEEPTPAPAPHSKQTPKSGPNSIAPSTSAPSVKVTPAPTAVGVAVWK